MFFGFLTHLTRTRSTSLKQPRRRARSHRIQLAVECLEDRQLMAGGVLNAALVVSPLSNFTPAGGSGSVNGAALWGPNAIRDKYGFNQLYTNTKLDGSGQTIAIVVAFDNPNLKPDLDAFDARFGIQAPLFKKASHPGVPVVDFSNSDQARWAAEAAMDVEWAHAIAPGANIIVYEAASASLSDMLAQVKLAANDPINPSVSVVSMSWGHVETGLEDASVFNQPANHIPVTFIAASGDQDFLHNGSQLNFPAVAPGVLSVGGTFLISNNYEIPWYYDSPSVNYFGVSDPSHIVPGGTLGGYSKFTFEPSYQSLVQQTTKRSVPDVSYNGDFNHSPIMVYEQNFGWINSGGTSKGAPQWAGLIALANQGRTKNNWPLLGDTVEDIYGLPASDFNDVTDGGTYMTGYDTLTGRGTPRADRIVPDLISNVEVLPHVIISSQVQKNLGPIYTTGVKVIVAFGIDPTAPTSSTVSTVTTTNTTTLAARFDADPLTSNFTLLIQVNPSATLSPHQPVNLLADPNAVTIVFEQLGGKSAGPKALNTAAVSALFAAHGSDRFGDDLGAQLALEFAMENAFAHSQGNGGR